MHNLDAEIAHWRAELVAAKIDSQSILELEAHLLDDVTRLVKAGVSPDEAFRQATQRIGEPKTLAREFAALSPWWLPAFRPAGMLLGLFAGIFALVVFMIGSKYSRGALSPLLAAHVVILTLGYLAVFATGAIGVFALVSGQRRGLEEPERRSVRRVLVRLTLVSGIALPIGIGLGMIWAGRHLGHAWIWAPAQTGAAFAGVSTLLLLLVHWLKLDNRRQCLVAALGASSLIIGWFGANATSSTALIAWLCGAFAVAQILALGVPETERC